MLLLFKERTKEKCLEKVTHNFKSFDCDKWVVSLSWVQEATLFSQERFCGKDWSYCVYLWL